MISKEAVVKLGVEAIRQAAIAGLTHVVLGVSVGALRALLEGNRMDGPFVTFWARVAYESGEEVEIKVPMFCDPSLEGYTIYAISWPRNAARTTHIPVE